MHQKILVLNQYALLRILKDFGSRMGMEETFADILAQAYVQLSPIAWRWTEFLGNNCTSCQLDPETCPFLNPSKETIRNASTTPQSAKAAVALMIENDKLKKCPAIQPQENP